MRYEYMCITAQLGRLLKQAELNAWGSDGWELIQVVGTTWYFKRELKTAPRQTRTKKTNEQAKQ